MSALAADTFAGFIQDPEGARPVRHRLGSFCRLQHLSDNGLLGNVPHIGELHLIESGQLLLSLTVVKHRSPKAEGWHSDRLLLDKADHTIEDTRDGTLQLHNGLSCALAPHALGMLTG